MEKKHMSRTRELVEEEILRVATQCFSEHGYQATTIEEIAARADISRVTFYTYFESKEVLLQTIFNRGLQTYQQGFDALLAAPLSRREKLRRIVTHQVRSLTADQQAIRIFFSEEQMLPPQLARHVQEFHRKIDRLLEHETSTGIDRGELIDAPPRLLMYALMGMCNWVYRWYRPGGAITPDAIIETFSRILESGCLRPQPEEKDLSKDLTDAERLRRLENSVNEVKETLKQVARHLHITLPQERKRSAVRLVKRNETAETVRPRLPAGHSRREKR